MGAISPDGKFLAYTPLGERFRQWKNYRGGTASRIWVLRLDDLLHEEVPKPAGGCNDTQPMWIGETVCSSPTATAGISALLCVRPAIQKKVEQPHPSRGVPGRERLVRRRQGHLRAGRAWITSSNPGSGKSHRLKIGVAADLTETRPRYATDGQAASSRTWESSPTGKRAMRWRYPRRDRHRAGEEGRSAQSYSDPGGRCPRRSPDWSPDGKSIAYFSDAAGEYSLIVRPQDGKGEGRSYTLKGAGFYEHPAWSPDGKEIAYIDNARTVPRSTLSRAWSSGSPPSLIYGPEPGLADEIRLVS